MQRDPNQICMLILIEVLILIKRIYLCTSTYRFGGLKYFDMPKIYVHDFSFDYIELENRLNENDFFVVLYAFRLFLQMILAMVGII